MIFRLSSSFAWLLLAVAFATAREGYVQTRDGKVFEGHVRFESNLVVVVSAERDLWVQIALTNLAGVTFAAESARAVPPPIQREQPGLPEPWGSEDVGSVQREGGAEFRSGAFRVHSWGTNILADSDSFHFVFKQVSGTSELVTRLTKVQLTDPWARAGLMMRESLAANSRNVFLSVTAARGGVFQWRERLGEETSVLLDRAITVPCWLKLKRDGNVFTALKSLNGRNWILVEKLTMPATREIYAGLAATGVRTDRLNESVFEHVEEGPSVRNRWFVPQVELSSGSAQSGHIAMMDDTAIRFESTARKEPLSSSSVANIRFQPMPSRQASRLDAGRSGVLLNTGEFIDGECRGIENGRVLLSSVPLGFCRYDVNSDVIAVVFRKRNMTKAHRYEITTTDGSTWLGTDLAIDEAGVLIREPMLGARWVPLHEVAEVRRRS